MTKSAFSAFVGLALLLAPSCNSAPPSPATEVTPTPAPTSVDVQPETSPLPAPQPPLAAETPTDLPGVVPPAEPVQPALDLSADKPAIDALTQLGVRMSETPNGWSIVIPDSSEFALVSLELAKLSSVLKIEKRGVTDEQLTQIVKLNNLRELDCNHSNLTALGFEVLAQAKNLKKLNLDGAKNVGEAEIADVAQLAILEDLKLDGVPLSGITAPLSRLTAMRHLSLLRCELTDDDLAFLAHMPELRSLNLSINRNLKGSSLKHIAGAKHLQHLQLGLTAVTDESIAPVAGLVELESLDLGSPNVTDAGLVYLSQMTKMKRLSFSNIKGTGLKHLREMKELTDIDFGYNLDFTGEGLEELAHIPGITELYLGWTGITDDGCAQLKKLSGLERLTLPNYGYEVRYKEQQPWADLHPNRLTDRGMTHIGELTNLVRLEFSGGGITDDGLKPLANLKQLKYLEFGILPNVKGPGLKSLKELTHLKNLTLKSTGIDEEGLQHLCGPLSLEDLLLPKTVSAAALPHVYQFKSIRRVGIWKAPTQEQQDEFKMNLPDSYIQVQIY